jgi:superfamily I DNA and RNA helicase
VAYLPKDIDGLFIEFGEDEATFEFYTSDFPTTYSVVIEGLTKDGRIVRQIEKIGVE